MNTRWSIKFCALAAAFCCVGVFSADAMAKHDKKDKHEKVEQNKDKDDQGKEQDKRGDDDRRKDEARDDHGRDNRQESYFRRQGYSRLPIPPDFYPRPGECFVWYPDRPARHRPKHIRCGERPPYGAWVIQHPRHHRGSLNVIVYDGPVLSIGEFDLRSGDFIRDLDADKMDWSDDRGYKDWRREDERDHRRYDDRYRDEMRDDRGSNDRRRDREQDDRGYDDRGRDREQDERGRGNRRESYFRKHGHSRLHIPSDFYPRPGECLVWYPDRPAGTRPERINCRMMPPQGAWVLHAPRHAQGSLNVRVYDGSVISIGEFNIQSGEFIRDLDSDDDN